MNKIIIAAILAVLPHTSFSTYQPSLYFGEKEEEIIFPSPPIGSEKIFSKNKLNFISIDKNSTQYIDIRAYGDSGWSWTHESPAMIAEFGKALDTFSPSGEIYQGDINFINWESTIGYTCEQWHAPYVRGRSYAFLAEPENIIQAIDRGIENFALSNNHTRDCVQNIDTGMNGQLSTVQYLEEIKSSYPSLNFHGVSSEADKNRIRLIKKKIKGVDLTIAFASYYTGRDSCPHSVCAEDADQIISNFKKITADLKILMIHTMSDQSKLVEVGSRFITEADGNIVFGSGPHRWKPIRHRNNSKGNAIIFDSLGNFLHPSMAAQSKNIIARILIDPNSKKIAQVQAISIRNELNTVVPSEVSPTVIDSEFEFISKDLISDEKSFKAMYFNF